MTINDPMTNSDLIKANLPQDLWELAQEYSIP